MGDRNASKNLWRSRRRRKTRGAHGRSFERGDGERVFADVTDLLSVAVFEVPEDIEHPVRQEVGRHDSDLFASARATPIMIGCGIHVTVICIEALASLLK